MPADFACATRRSVLEQTGNTPRRLPPRPGGLMNSPPVAMSATDRTEVRRRDWAGEPGLLLGEDAHGYEELLAQVRRALAPRDVMEEMWIRDLVDLAWDVFRLRRMKASLMRIRAD